MPKIYTTRELHMPLPYFVNELTGETGFAQGRAFVMASTKDDAAIVLQKAGLYWAPRQLRVADAGLPLLDKLLKEQAVNRRGQIVLVNTTAKGPHDSLVAWDGQGWTWIGSWNPCEGEIVLPEKNRQP